MAMRAAARSCSGLMRAATLRRQGGSTGSTNALPSGKRSFSSAGHHDDAHETAKWEKITYLGIATCTILAIYNLSKGHPHYDKPPAYTYLHIRNKEFPWGPNGLFESNHSDH